MLLFLLVLRRSAVDEAQMKKELSEARNLWWKWDEDSGLKSG